MARWKKCDWLNGHYELLMVFRDHHAWIEAAQTLWALPCFSGVWTEHEFDPQIDPRHDARDILVACELTERNLLGVAHLPDGRAVPCGTAVSASNDWLALFLPLAGLESAYDVGRFPFGDRDRPWIAELNDWFVEIGSNVFRRAPFEIAAVGFEIEVSAVFDIFGAKEIPQHRPCGLLAPSGQDVQWYPPT